MSNLTVREIHSSLPSLSAALTKAIETTFEGFGGPNGYDLRPARWNVPDNLSPDVIGEAKAKLAPVEVAMAARDRPTVIIPWLESLGVLTAAAGMTVADAKVKCAAYAHMLSRTYSAAIFTEANLDRTARCCKWFPSYAELTAILDKIQNELETKARRLRRVAEHIPKVHETEREWTPPTEAEKAEASRLLAEAKRALLGDKPSEGTDSAPPEGLSGDELTAWWVAKMASTPV